MESGDTWVCPYVLSSQGWVKASPVESWFREGLGTNIAVESCAKLWKPPVSLPMACAHSACPCGGHEILQPLLLIPYSPAQGWRKPHCLHLPSSWEKNKSKVITSGLDYSGTEEGRALPRQWALLTPAPWVRFLVSSKGLVLLQLYPQ